MPRRNAGFSLIETLIAIVLLGALVVPTCTALVMSVRLNDRTEEMLQAQLAVSSAVETLMAEGMKGVAYDEEKAVYVYPDKFDDANVLITDASSGIYYKIQVFDGETPEGSLVVVETTIRKGDS